MTDSTYADNYFYLDYKLEGDDLIPSNNVALMSDLIDADDIEVLATQFMSSDDKSFSFTVNDYPASGDVLTASFDGSVLDFDMSGVESTDIIVSSFYCTRDFLNFMGGFVVPETPIVSASDGK